MGAQTPATIHIDGDAGRRHAGGEARALGLAFVPEERTGRGAVPNLGPDHNTCSRTIPAEVSRAHLGPAITALAASIIERFGVQGCRPHGGGPESFRRQPAEIHRRSRGGQQPRVFVVAQPTWGGRRRGEKRIRAEIVALRDGGAADAGWWCPRN